MPDAVLVAIIGALATIGAALIGVLLKNRRAAAEDEASPLSSSAEARRKRQHKYDVFVSAPMAGFASDDAIAADHARIVPIVAMLEGPLACSVYWAGRNIRAKADFEAADLSAMKDVSALLDSKYFLLLYPERIASSVLFEAGIALRACLTSIYYVRDRADLPFLMTQASQAFTNVRMYEGSVPDGLAALLQRHGKAFFDPRPPA